MMKAELSVSLENQGGQVSAKQPVNRRGAGDAIVHDVCVSQPFEGRVLPAGLHCYSGRLPTQSAGAVVDFVVDGTSIPLISAAEIKLFNEFTEGASNNTQKGTVKTTGQLVSVIHNFSIWWLMLGGQVAVKSLPFFSGRDLYDITYRHSEAREWFKRCLSLKHPRIADLLGCMLTNNSPTVVTVWYSNGDVANLLKVAPLVQRRLIVSFMDNDSRTCSIFMINSPFSFVKLLKPYPFCIDKSPQSFVQILSR